MKTSRLVSVCMLACVMILGFAVQGKLFSDSTVYAQGSSDRDDNGRGRGNSNGRGNDRVTICHNGHTITISENGLRGHFNNNGSPRRGHENDTMGACEDEDTDNVIFVPGNCGVQVDFENEIVLPVECDDDVDVQQIIICHVEGDVTDAASYETLSLNVSELSDHFYPDGSARENHLNDTFGYCPDAPQPEPRPVIPGIAPTFQPFSVGQAVCADWFVYHTNRTGNWEIFRAGNAPEANTLNLSQGATVDVAPSLSPDRQWIVFTSNRDGNWELYVARTDGSMVQRVTNTLEAEVDPMWAPVGSQVIYQRITTNGSRDLYIIDLSTVQVMPVSVSDWHDANPYWSPDGTSILFQSNRDGTWQVYQYNFASRQLQRMTTSNENYTDPMYSSTGAFISYRALLANGNSVIRVMNNDGTNIRNVTAEVSYVDNPAWSPDDSAIAYESNVDGDRDIYIYEVATGQTRRLTANPGDEYAPTWFCGTQTVLFTANVNNNTDIYSANAFPMSAAPIQVEQSATRWTADPAADQYPLQSPNEENATRPDETGLN